MKRGSQRSKRLRRSSVCRSASCIACANDNVREVLTSSIGAPVQQDASTHRWSPLTSEKWTLITAIDDFSRLLLFADFFPTETTWAHIQATRTVMENFGVPLRYYVDSLRVFHFV